MQAVARRLVGIALGGILWLEVRQSDPDSMVLASARALTASVPELECQRPQMRRHGSEACARALARTERTARMTDWFQLRAPVCKARSRARKAPVFPKSSAGRQAQTASADARQSWPCSRVMVRKMGGSDSRRCTMPPRSSARTWRTRLRVTTSEGGEGGWLCCCAAHASRGARGRRDAILSQDRGRPEPDRRACHSRRRAGHARSVASERVRAFVWGGLGARPMPLKMRRVMHIGHGSSVVKRV